MPLCNRACHLLIHSAQDEARTARADRHTAVAELDRVAAAHEAVASHLSAAEDRAIKAEKALLALRRQFALETRKWHAAQAGSDPEPTPSAGSAKARRMPAKRPR